jgi:hypothetical protein
MTDQDQPLVEPGQYWNLAKKTPNSDPRRIRVLAGYLDSPDDNQLWIVETTGVYDDIWRIPEGTLRVYYELDEKGEL